MMLEKGITFIIHIVMRMITWVPFSILFFFSRILAFLLYHVLIYRRDTVDLNLIYALPDMESDRFNKIARRFYKHLSELIFEIIKGFYITPGMLRSRVEVTEGSVSLLQRLEQEKRHVVTLLGHYGNWEWALLSIGTYTHLKPYAFYAPLSNKSLDEYLKSRRERFGATMVDARKARDFYKTVHQQPSLIAVVGDQSPTGRRRTYTTRFLNLETSFYDGGERLARNLNAAVIYVHIKKQGFGRYTIDLELIAEQPEILPEGAITKAFANKLERDIREEPQWWIWSHRRWKGTIHY